MGKWEKLTRQIVEGKSDANIAFDDLVNLLLHFGFEVRTRGSHHVFRKAGVSEKVNLQRDGNKAKPYQVRQVRSLILQHRLGENR
jgi:predicted RNA binding protein YcfA (HicA-like mRNA interferase family)